MDGATRDIAMRFNAPTVTDAAAVPPGSTPPNTAQIYMLKSDPELAKKIKVHKGIEHKNAWNDIADNGVDLRAVGGLSTQIETAQEHILAVLGTSPLGLGKDAGNHLSPLSPYKCHSIQRHYSYRNHH